MMMYTGILTVLFSTAIFPPPAQEGWPEHWKEWPQAGSHIEMDVHGFLSEAACEEAGRSSWPAMTMTRPPGFLK